MKILKIQDLETLQSMQMYENDKGRFFIEILSDETELNFITLDKSDAQVVIEELNAFIHGRVD